jgi:hypothetical protein
MMTILKTHNPKKDSCVGELIFLSRSNLVYRYFAEKNLSHFPVIPKPNTPPKNTQKTFLG